MRHEQHNLSELSSSSKTLASLRLSGHLIIVATSWIAIHLGHACLRSFSFEDSLKVKDPKSEAMLISLWDRLYVISVIGGGYDALDPLVKRHALVFRAAADQARLHGL